MKSIRLKLAIAFVLSSAASVAGMSVYIHWSFDRGFANYVNAQELQQLSPLKDALISAYQDNKSWDFLRENPRVWRALHRETIDLDGPPPRDFDGRRPERPPPRPDEGFRPPPKERRGDRPPPGNRRGPETRPENPGPKNGLPGRVVLFDQYGDRIIGNPAISLDSPKTSKAAVLGVLDLYLNGDVIGRLALEQSKTLKDIQDLGFAAQQNKQLILISVFMIALALLASIPLAGHLVRPVRALLEATRSLASGNYQTRTKVSSMDELGQLTEHFNSLAATLEANESSRQRWISDISHELRTPIAVLKSQIEAVVDGIRVPNSELITSLNNKVNHLNALVDDLYQLSLSDAGALSYRKTALSLSDLLQSAVDDYQTAFEEKNIQLSLNVEGLKQDQILADGDRLLQLFNNLMTNSLRYTDPGGCLQIEAKSNRGGFELSFSDSSPGVADVDLPRLFERLFRVERSRNRASGGAGLGLSLCENIVQAHQGEIGAHQSPLGGVQIRFTLKA
jgi:two-component system sensor histidine kinase BaeS